MFGSPDFAASRGSPAPGVSLIRLGHACVTVLCFLQAQSSVSTYVGPDLKSVICDAVTCDAALPAARRIQDGIGGGARRSGSMQPVANPCTVCCVYNVGQQGQHHFHRATTVCSYVRPHLAPGFASNLRTPADGCHQPSAGFSCHLRVQPIDTTSLYESSLGTVFCTTP